MHSSKFAALALLSVAVSSATAQSLLVTNGQVVASDGDAVAAIPGAALAASSAVESPALDLNGNLLFRAAMATNTTLGITTANHRLLYYGRTASDLTLVARGGDPEPTGTIPGAILGTGTASGIGSGARLSPQNSILLWASSLSGGSVVTTGTGATGRNDSAIFWGPIGGQSILVRRGDLTPGGGGSFLNTAFTSISGQTTTMNASGTVALQATLEGGDVVASTNNFAWIYGTPNSLQLMLRKGDTFAVPGGTAVIGTVGFGGQMNDLGMVLHDEKFSTTLGTAPATTANDGLLMLFTPGIGNQILVREGDPAVGTAGAAYNTFQMATVGLTRNGGVGFSASLIGGDTVTGVGGNDQAIYLGNIGGGFTMVLRKGDLAPGTTGGETIASMNNSSYSITDSSYVTFMASLAGPNVTTANDGCIYVGTPGNLVLVAREGDAAPGMPNFTFSSITYGSCHLNERGQVIFSGEVTDGTSLLRAYWGYTPNQPLVRVLLENDTFATSTGPQVSYTIGGNQFNSGDGCPMSFNNNGDFAYRAAFTGNGTGANVRGHLGGLQASPASVSSAGGTQTWAFDAGIANAGGLYVLAGTLSGTRPGFNFGTTNVPLNQDVWFQNSLAAGNSAFYTNSWGLLDANGKANGSWNFPAGFGWLNGAMFHHAFVVLDLATVQPSYVSNPTSVKLY
jgi:hypothetical protein